MKLVHTKPTLGAVIIAFVAFLLAVCYGVVTPLWEGPDEPIHFDVVKYIADHHRLPALFEDGVNLGQTLQPPLFYALSAATVQDVDTGDIDDARDMNPFFWGLNIGEEHAYALHPEEAPWPWTGTSLAVHRIRLVQAFFISISVIATYFVGREVYPMSEEPALMAALFAAFVPGFIKIHSYVNNDALLATLASLATLIFVRTAIRGACTRRTLTAGILLGLVLLTKQSVVLFVPAYGLLILRDALRRGSVCFFLTQSLVMAIPVLALVGWWYRRNCILYGDPLGTTYYFKYAVNPGFPDLTSHYISKAVIRLVEGYWGRFGWGSIRMSGGIYLANSTFVLVALGGHVYGVFAGKNREAGSDVDSRQKAAFGWIGAMAAGLLLWYGVYLSRMGPVALQARYLYPLHSSFSVLVAGGLWQLASRRKQGATLPDASTNKGDLLLIGVPYLYLFSVAVLAPFVYVMPLFD